MGASPPYKVYDHEGQYVAACRYVSDAAAIVACHDTPGWTIRYGHHKRSTLWTEGQDGQAGESYDHVVEVAEKLMRSRSAR